jgi:hypothetical protein
MTSSQTKPEIPEYPEVFELLRKNECRPGSTFTWGACVALLDEAVRVERERCAKIAEGNVKQFDFEKALYDCDDAMHGHFSARLQIAVDIRDPKGGA